MKNVKCFFIALSVMVTVQTHAQLAVATVSNPAVEDIMRDIIAVQDRFDQLQNGIKTLQTLNQSLQYQIKAFDALSEGSWDGFVEFFGYQTNAIVGYNDTIANLNTIPGMFKKRNEDGTFSDTFTSDTYLKLKTHSNNISRSMVAANGMVLSTDNLVKASEYNFRLMQDGFKNTANASNALQALQGNAQILAAIANENNAVTQLLHTEQRYLQTLIQGNEDISRLNNEIIRRMMAAPDEHDPDNPYRRGKSAENIKRSISGEFIFGTQEALTY